MQERPQYKVTPEQGWSQMQSLLDKSMPVAHRSRRVIVFWWSSAIAIVSILASFFLMQANTSSKDLQHINTPVKGMTKNEVISSAPGSQSMASSSPTLGANKSSAKNADPKMNEMNSENRKIKSSSSASKTGFKNSKNVKATKNLTDHKSIVISENPTNKPYDRGLKDNAVVSGTNERQDDGILNVESNSSQMEIVSSSDEHLTLRQQQTALEFLPFADASFYDFIDPSIELVQPGNSSFSKGRHVFSPNISISGMTGSQSGLGFSGAIGTDYAISSKLSLAASVGLRSYHPGALNQRNQKDILLINSPDPIIADTNYTETYIVGAKVNTSADFNAINHFVQSIRQWEVTAGLKYTLSKRFFVEGGMVLGFGTTVRSEYPIVSFSSSVNTTADTNVASTFNSYNIISSSMTSLYGGIGYHINRHLNVTARWTQGLDHYLLNDQSISMGSTNKRLDYIRGLNLKLAFNL